jgi:hypothetical protein
MAWAASQLTYRAASEAFARLARQVVSPSAIWEMTQVHGERLRQTAAAAEAATPVERTQVPPPGQDQATPKAVSLDGGKMYIRGEGWKEFKAGTVGDIVVTPELTPDTQEWEDRAHVVNLRYRAALGDVATFTPVCWYLAVQAQVPATHLLAVTADGADWIWNLTTDLFPDSVQIVDWYHATEYLAHAAEALFPEDEAAAHRWQQERRNDLFRGQHHKIIDPLRQANLLTQAEYFQRHTRRMNYQTFREDGYPIGSGAVESGIKQFKHRLTGPGMRWSRPGAERMLVLRAAVLSETFDKQWSQN